MISILIIIHLISNLFLQQNDNTYDNQLCIDHKAITRNALKSSIDKSTKIVFNFLRAIESQNVDSANELRDLLNSLSVKTEDRQNYLVSNQQDLQNQSEFTSQLLITELFNIEKNSIDEDKIGYLYSLLKLGKSQQVQKYSEMLLSKLSENMGSLINRFPNDWVVVSVGGFGIPNAASLVTARVAEKLKLPHIMIETGLRSNQAQTLNYASFARKKEREIIVHNNLKLKDEHSIRGKKVIFIDDAVMSGTILKESTSLLLSIGAKQIEYYVLAKLDSKGDNSFEDRINRKAIGKNRIETLIEILNAEDAIYTTRLIYYAFELNTDDFCQLLKQLNPLAKFNLYLYSIEYFGSKSPSNVDLLLEEMRKDVRVYFPDSETLRTIESEEFWESVGSILKRYKYKVPLESAEDVSDELVGLLLEESRKSDHKEVILYDLNNTLLFSSQYLNALRQATIDSLSIFKGISKETIQIRMQTLRTLLLAEGLDLTQHEIAKEFEISDTELDVEIVKRLHAKDYIDKDYVLRKILERQKRAGYRLGIVSDGTYAQQIDILKALEVDDLFEHIITSDRTGHFKPEFDMYKAALNTFGINAQAVVMVGDNVLLDILPAMFLGMKTITICSQHDLFNVSKNIIELALKKQKDFPEKLVEEKFKGALIGTYIGDALGMPFEQIDYEEMQTSYGKVTRMFLGNKRHTTETKIPITLSAGQATDDTLLMIAVAESILEYGRVLQEPLIKRFADYYDQNVGFSHRTASILKAVKQGIPWQQLVDKKENQSPSNGASMRIAQIILRYHNDFGLLEKQLLDSAKITHSHPLALLGVLVQGFALTEALNLKANAAFDPIDFTNRLIKHVREFEEKYLQDQDVSLKNIFSQKLEIVKELLQRKNVTSGEVVQRLGNDFTASGSIPTSIYSFLRYHYSFREAVSFSVSLGGDTDTIGAMTGALSGAFLGITAIPKGWIENLHPIQIEGNEKDKNYVLLLAAKLFQVDKSEKVTTMLIENSSPKSLTFNIIKDNIYNQRLAFCA